LYGLNINFVRPFNVYGKRQSTRGGYAAAIPNFIEAIKNGGRQYITGDGKQVRDFVYIDDVVDLMLSVASSDLSGEAFNAGSGTYTSVQEIYDTICKIMKSDVKPEYVSPIPEPETQADISKAKKMLGWTPKVDLKEGLRRTIE
jgi:nucleoside-diphosphate-sugar epimerase